MQLKQKLRSLALLLRSFPLKYTVLGGALVVGAILYSAFFILEKPVRFTYAGQTCIDRLTLLPDIHMASVDSEYSIGFAKRVSVGGWTVAARSICIMPSKAPRPGVAKVSLAPYGSFLARQTFAVTVAPPVEADATILSKPIAVSRPLKVKLSGNDKIFSYVLQIADKRADCSSKEPAALVCDIEKMNLAQSQSYPAKLVRQFNNQDIATIISKDIQTLSATTLTDSSIKQNEVVYAKPTQISIMTDKKLISAESTLYRRDGDTRIEVPSSIALTDTGFTVAFAEELPRLMAYELITKRVEALDGSGLVQPHSLSFTTSGGPKVTGVNANATGVPANSTVAISFDQSLSETQDIGKAVSLSGGATFAGAQGDKLLVSVSDVPKCGDFTIKLTADLQSKYGIGGQSTWTYAGRTVCYTVGSIGTSSQGRAINAYYFGSGATSILYTGAIHGDEVSTKLLMDRWIQDLDAKARAIPSNVTVVVVPTINPDGYARGERTNVRNVDLNRNFATSDWRKDITTVSNQPFPGGGGETAMSEPETKAIAALAQQLRPKLIVSYHSIGGLVAANQAGNSIGLAAVYSQLSGYKNVTGQSDSTFEYSVTGTADDWYAQAIGVPSLLVELGSHTSSQFERNQAAMWAMINS
jgi:predicted deacylase